MVRKMVRLCGTEAPNKFNQVDNSEFEPSLDFIKAQERLFLQSKTLPHSRSKSALSDATEILTDYDTDSLEASSDSSPYTSGGSVRTPHQTASTCTAKLTREA
jgi:hypothetical protein